VLKSVDGVDDFNAAKRLSIFTVNTGQRGSTRRVNGLQPNSTRKNPMPNLSGLIVHLCYRICRLSANRVGTKPPKLGVDESRNHQRRPTGKA
jgi:hypothetical protein